MELTLGTLSTTPLQLALIIVVLGAIFTIAWYIDHRTHLRIWQKDITDGELRTHRMILYASWVLQGSLIAMYWAPLIALPFFAGAWVTRLVHEGIDEWHWHLPRCTERETIIHLIMWLSIHAGTATTFLWGFFFQFRGILELPLWIPGAMIAITIAMTWIGNHELNDYRVRDSNNLGRV